jgi:hypothetical protein
MKVCPVMLLICWRRATVGIPGEVGQLPDVQSEVAHRPLTSSGGSKHVKHNYR